MNGTGGVGLIAYFADVGEDFLYVGGTHSASLAANLFHPSEFTTVIDQVILANGGVLGGEDGWAWGGGERGVDRFMIWSVRQLAVSEPGTSILFAAAFLIIAVVKIALPSGVNRRGYA